MKKILSGLLLLSAQTVIAAGNIGGMDGGGGGTLPAQPVSTYKVQEIVSESKSKLLFLFNDYEMRLKYGVSTPVISKLFLGPKKVQEVLKGLRVEVRMDRPCLTSLGTPVDGSIYGVKPNTICLSADRISKKVDQAVAEREILALLAHEVSHFMGADESEATQLQKEIASAILYAPLGSEIDSDKVRDAVSDSTNLLRRTVEALENSELALTLKRMSETLAALGGLERESNTTVFAVFGPREKDYHDFLSLKLAWAKKYLSTQVSGPDQGEAQAEYEARFNGRDHFLFVDELPLKDHTYANEKIFKIRTMGELAELLQSMLREYEVRSAYIYQTTFGNDWLNLDGHLTKTFTNPWGDFAGTYTVLDVKCSGAGTSASEKDLKELKVYKQGDTYFLGLRTSSGYSNDRIELGAYNVNSYLNDYGMVAPNKVYMTHEMGGTWSNRMYLHRTTSRLTLETSADQTFTVEIENTFENRDVTQPDSKTICTLNGSYQK